MASTAARLNEQDLLQVRAREVDMEVREIDEQNKKNWYRLGKLCIECQDTELWKAIGFKDYESWLTDAAPHSRSTGFSAVTAIRELQDHISEEDLSQMPHGNAHVLRQVSDSVKRDPEIIEAAKKLPKKKLVAKIQDKHPDQHIEQEVSPLWHFTESQLKVVDEAIEVALQQVGGTSRESALEFICNDFMQSKL